jgi:DNA polymerase-3 subunit epsilon/oligoribonuclease
MFWAYCHLSPGAPKSEFFKEMSLSKDAIAARLGLPPEEKPHRALNGVAHLLACYRHFMKVT